MDPSVARAVKKKRILLFNEMLIDTGSLDIGVDELQWETELDSEISVTGMFRASLFRLSPRWMC